MKYNILVLVISKDTKVEKITFLKHERKLENLNMVLRRKINLLF